MKTNLVGQPANPKLQQQHYLLRVEAAIGLLRTAQDTLTDVNHIDVGHAQANLRVALESLLNAEERLGGKR